MEINAYYLCPDGVTSNVPMINFSFHEPWSHGTGWEWVMDLSERGSAMVSSDSWMTRIAVAELQREHGCANVCGGQPHHAVGLGVYVGPHEGKHRDGQYAYMCRCLKL